MATARVMARVTTRVMSSAMRALVVLAICDSPTDRRDIASYSTYLANGAEHGIYAVSVAKPQIASAEQST
jgi:hypothetical protein